jgi:hypothetical protein
MAKRLPEAVERLATTTGQQSDIQTQSNALQVSLEKLRDRTALAAKLLAEA